MPKSDGIRLEVAKPCPVSWDSMAGDERVRFCAICQKCVYNLSAMKLPEAQQLMKEREGNVCVRFFQREDGTVMTSDCGFGLARAVSGAGKLARRGLGALVGLLGLAGAAAYFSDDLRSAFGVNQGAAVNALATPPPAKPNPQLRGIMGFASQATSS